MDKNGSVSQKNVMQSMTQLIARGTCVVVVAFLVLLLISFFIAGNHGVADRFFVAICASVFCGVVVYLARSRYYMVSAWLIIGFYLMFAAGIFMAWGINTPLGVLLLGFTIVLAGVMLGPFATIATTLLAIFELFVSQFLYVAGILEPNYKILATAPSYGDAFGYALILLIAALVSWLSRRQLERSLQRAIVAEGELVNEKKLLARRLAERTRELKNAQLEEMQQLYHFAELGQASTTILHELANHLTVLMLSIDELPTKRRDGGISQAKESIKALDDMITQARKRLVIDSSARIFSLEKVIEEVIDDLRGIALRSGIVVKLDPAESKKELTTYGDPLYLTQIMRILINNSIEAHERRGSKNKYISVSLSEVGRIIKISVVDNGSGIEPSMKGQLFKVHKSKKSSGMGIGLYIAKELAEFHFQGGLTYNKSRKDATQFDLILTNKTHSR